MTYRTQPLDCFRVHLAMQCRSHMGSIKRCILTLIPTAFLSCLAMGFQRSPSSCKQKLQSVATTTVDGDKEYSFITASIPYLRPSRKKPISFHSNYSSWMAKHPSALASFDRMMKATKGKTIAVFLDYDGTLSPIVDDPDRAVMSDEMRAAVRKVARNFPTAIITGRSRDKVKDFVKVDNVYYAGSHGMDIVGPLRPLGRSDGRNHNIAPDKGSEVLFQPAKEYLPAIQKIYTILEEKTKPIQGARVEDNGFCISVHFRNVQEEDYVTLEETIMSVVENYPEFYTTVGKMVLEVRPSVEWNKGHALEYLLDIPGFSNSSDVVPLYIGDDRSDEDAFKVIRSRGEGYPIIVSSIPKDTKASYSLRDPSEVLTFLLRLAESRKPSSSGRSIPRSTFKIWK